MIWRRFDSLLLIVVMSLSDNVPYLSVGYCSMDQDIFTLAKIGHYHFGITVARPDPIGYEEGET